MVTQVSLSDISLSHAEQAHEPLKCHSSRFTTTKMGWSTVEEKSYAELALVERSYRMAACPADFDLFIDRNNLVFVFESTKITPDIGQGSLQEVLRWSVRMSAYNYVCIRIRGVENFRVVLITRWYNLLTICRLVSIPHLPTTFHDFNWPSRATIRTSKDTHAAFRLASAILCDSIWHVSDPVTVSVSDDGKDLHLRLTVKVHTGVAGHRGRRATKCAIAAEFSWATLEGDIRIVVASCIHFISTMREETVLLPFGPTLYGTNPKSHIQFDYIEHVVGLTGEKYFLMMMDDHSGYIWL